MSAISDSFRYQSITKTIYVSTFYFSSPTSRLGSKLSDSKPGFKYHFVPPSNSTWGELQGWSGAAVSTAAARNVVFSDVTLASSSRSSSIGCRQSSVSQIVTRTAAISKSSSSGLERRRNTLGNFVDPGILLQFGERQKRPNYSGYDARCLSGGILLDFAVVPQSQNTLCP